MDEARQIARREESDASLPRSPSEREREEQDLCRGGGLPKAQAWPTVHLGLPMALCDSDRNTGGADDHAKRGRGLQRYDQAQA